MNAPQPAHAADDGFAAVHAAVAAVRAAARQMRRSFGLPEIDDAPSASNATPITRPDVEVKGGGK